MTIYAKMNAVMSETSRIPKSGYNSSQRYSYATAGDVIDTVRALMVKHGLAFTAQMKAYTKEEFTTAKGTVGYKTHIHMQYTIADCETGEKIDLDWFGEADDYQDKGLSKGSQLATKYFLLNTFLISTGDPTEDSDSGHNLDNTERAPRSVPQSKPSAPPKPAPSSNGGAVNDSTAFFSAIMAEVDMKPPEIMTQLGIKSVTEWKKTVADAIRFLKGAPEPAPAEVEENAESVPF